MKKIHSERLFGGWHFISVLLIIYDLAAIFLSYFSALWLRFDCALSAIPQRYFSVWLNFTPFTAVFSAAVFALLSLYRSIWKFAGYMELHRACVGTALSVLFNFAGISLVFGRMPVLYYIVGGLLEFILVLGIRFAYRLFLLVNGSRKNAADIPVMLIGAGSAGHIILRDVNRSTVSADKVVCIIDDDCNTWGRSIDGVSVVGGREDILRNAEKFGVRKIFLAIPTASRKDKRDILNICRETDCELKALPGIHQIINNEVTVSSLKKVSIEDLLGRDVISPDMSEVNRFIRGKTVLITGGGGSIGSELCRQVAAHGPRQLIIFDIYENNAYAIQLELKKAYPSLDLVTLIGSVRDSRKLFEVFEKYHVDIVYHAAAHKHVPLMETSPCEAIKNNVIGTYKTAYAAMVSGVKRFVLISTDKAVNPTNIMGASKRLCEMIVQSFDAKVREGRAEEIPQLFTHFEFRGEKRRVFDFDGVCTEFVAVRFGNVLGSNGSVIPIFRRQIEQGGPVTVTSPDINRYFITIPEGVSLVMLAGTKAKGGEIFVLDMGDPVRIDDLARNMIRLSGLRPDVDIKIEYTGLRPGEKLYEEKLMSEEGLRKTDDDLIYIGNPIPLDVERLLGQLDLLMKAAYENDENIREIVADMVPTYHEAGIVNTGFKEKNITAEQSRAGA